MNDYKEFIKKEFQTHIKYLQTMSVIISKMDDEMMDDVGKMISDYKSDTSLLTDERIVDFVVRDTKVRVFTMDRIKIGSKVRFMYSILGDELLEGESDVVKNITNSLLVESRDLDIKLEVRNGVLVYQDSESEDLLRKTTLEKTSHSDKAEFIKDIEWIYNENKKKQDAMERRKQEIADRIRTERDKMNSTIKNNPDGEKDNRNNSTSRSRQGS